MFVLCSIQWSPTTASPCIQHISCGVASNGVLPLWANSVVHTLDPCMLLRETPVLPCILLLSSANVAALAVAIGQGAKNKLGGKRGYRNTIQR